MNRTLILLALALVTVSPLSLANAARTMSQIRSSGVLTLGTEGAFPPFNFYDRKNLVGFEIDLGNALGKTMNLKVRWLAQPFDGLLISLNQGRFDAVMASHAITPERRKAVDFVTPHYCSPVNIVAKKGGPLTLAALVGKTAGTQVGTAQLPILQAVKGIGGVKTFPDDNAVMLALETGRVDAWTSNGPVVAYMLKQAKLQGGYVIGDAISQERNAMAVAKGNTPLLGALGAALLKVQADGTYARLSQKWFGRDIRCK